MQGPWPARPGRRDPLCCIFQDVLRAVGGGGPSEDRTQLSSRAVTSSRHVCVPWPSPAVPMGPHMEPILGAQSLSALTGTDPQGPRTPHLLGAAEAMS